MGPSILETRLLFSIQTSNNHGSALWPNLKSSLKTNIKQNKTKRSDSRQTTVLQPMTADIDVTKPHWADRQVNRIFSNGWLKNGKKIHRTRDQCQNHGDHSGPTCEGLPNNQTYSQQQCFHPAPMASPGLETIFQFNRRQHGIIKPTQTDGSLDAGSTAHALFLETFFETTTMEIWWNMDWSGVDARWCVASRRAKHPFLCVHVCVWMCVCMCVCVCAVRFYNLSITRHSTYLHRSLQFATWEAQTIWCVTPRIHPILVSLPWVCARHCPYLSQDTRQQGKHWTTCPTVV